MEAANPGQGTDITYATDIHFRSGRCTGKVRGEYWDSQAWKKAKPSRRCQICKWREGLGGTVLPRTSLI